MLIFNAIQHEIAEIRERIEILGADSPTALRDKQRLDLLLSMEAYIKSLVWVQKEQNRPILRDFIVSQHDYQSIAEKYHYSVGRVYSLVHPGFPRKHNEVTTRNTQNL